MYRDFVSGRIIEAAMKVHSFLGPGLLESAYETCLCHELLNSGFGIERQRNIPLIYDGVRLDIGFRMDLLVENTVVVEVKAVEKIIPVHRAQLYSYLRLSGHGLGLLLNFNVTHMREGIIRMAMDRTNSAAAQREAGKADP